MERRCRAPPSVLFERESDVEDEEDVGSPLGWTTLDMAMDDERRPSPGVRREPSEDGLGLWPRATVDPRRPSGRPREEEDE